MKLMKLKKILVAALAVTMIMGSSSMAFAAQEKGEAEGTGGLDVVKDSDVFSVVVPTDAGTTFDYIVDPLGVITATEAQKYGGKVFEDDQSVYFQNTDKEVSAGEYNYSGTSNKLKAINKSTKKVAIAVKATLTDTEEVTMGNATAAGSTSDTVLNLAVNGQVKGDNVDSKDMVTGTTGVTLDGEIPALANAYKSAYVNGKYVQQLDPAKEDSDFDYYEFWLTGKASKSETWRTVEKVPKVKLVWTVTGDGAGVASGPAVTLSSSGLITMTGLTGEANATLNVADYKLGLSGDTLYPLDAKESNMEWLYSEWSQETGGKLQIQLKGAYLGDIFTNTPVDVEVTLSNGQKIKCTGTIVK